MYECVYEWMHACRHVWIDNTHLINISNNLTQNEFPIYI